MTYLQNRKNSQTERMNLWLLRGRMGGKDS